MPYYEYWCPGCGKEFESVRQITGRDLVSCPSCYAKAVRKMSIPGKCVVKMAIHTDSGLPQEYINHARTPELYERNLSRYGGKPIDPEDM